MDRPIFRAGRGTDRVTDTPLVSVAIPAFRAEEHIGRAIESVARSGLPLSEVELAIAPDDGRDYRAFVPAGFKVAQAEPGPLETGVGIARNRAVAVATGEYLAFLDADDTWEAGYLSDALSIAREDGLVFSPTRVFKNGSLIIQTLGGAEITFADFSETGASHHAVVHRSRVGIFRDGPSQDILHAIELLSLNGGSAKASRRGYEIQLTDGSVSRSLGFAERVGRAYDEIIDEILSGQTRVPEAMRGAAADVFREKKILNERFKTSGAPGFYEFMSDVLRQN